MSGLMKIVLFSSPVLFFIFFWSDIFMFDEANSLIDCEGRILITIYCCIVRIYIYVFNKCWVLVIICGLDFLLPIENCWYKMFRPDGTRYYVLRFFATDFSPSLHNLLSRWDKEI